MNIRLRYHNTICEPFLNCYQKFGNANCLKHLSVEQAWKCPWARRKQASCWLWHGSRTWGACTVITPSLCQAFLLQLRPCGWMGTTPQVQSLVKSLVKRGEQGHGFGISSVLRCPHFWPYSVYMLIIVIY